MLHGERVVLRPVRPADLEPCWRARLDPLTWARTSEQPYVPETLDAYRARRTERRTRSDAELSVDVDDALVGRAALSGVDDLARSGGARPRTSRRCAPAARSASSRRDGCGSPPGWRGRTTTSCSWRCCGRSGPGQR